MVFFYEHMVDWKNSLQKVKLAIDTIQANPVYNEMVSDALTLIPVGSIKSCRCNKRIIIIWVFEKS